MDNAFSDTTSIPPSDHYVLHYHTSIHPTDTHFLDTTAIPSNVHSLLPLHMLSYPTDNHFLGTISIYAIAHFLPHARKSILSKDIHVLDTIAKHSSDHSLRQYDMSVHSTGIRFLDTIAVQSSGHSLLHSHRFSCPTHNPRYTVGIVALVCYHETRQNDREVFPQNFRGNKFPRVLPSRPSNRFAGHRGRFRGARRESVDSLPPRNGTDGFRQMITYASAHLNFRMRPSRRNLKMRWLMVVALLVAVVQLR